jgi:HSP20 family molecular chaperone IbpA
MAISVRRSGHSVLPDFTDWFETFPPLFGWRPGAEVRSPRIEDYAEGDQHVIRVELPGINPDEDLDITVDEGVLTIRAERSEQTTDKQHSEFQYGSFVRAVRLPPGAREDQVKASYADGILTIRVTCGEPKATQRKIKVKREGS